ncbi:DNA-binding transcriptional regulator, LysR family [Prosthecobacter debontii]|uniref:DNA-binding transcriptional regulator, LysR family n=1 Tax=Prosthecobacter debontii TaxID=48467 RepID=A0A1T4WFC7_9BACT|nr:LysR substrate-binding domain-containing protein [Prosthecobacter debontii]SKA75887.1 DNA-binding transcriptional regulator, LysR family [Prosthecobacter debontii]
MELRHLRSFQTVAEELNYSRAAEKLHVAQSALSRTIADLEFEMEVKLLERSTHGVALTEAGTLFLSKVRLILEDTRDAVAEAQRRARGETGTLRIGFIGTLSHSLLPHLLQTYRAQYPSVDLILSELGPTPQRERIHSGHLDCGFIGFAVESPDPGLEMIVVAEDDLMAAIPSNHPLAKQSTVGLADLKDEAFYLTAQANAPVFNPWLMKLCENAGFQPRIARETDRAATVLNYVAAGFGVSLFPARIASFATPGVRFLPMKGRLPKYQYKLAWLRRSQSPALVKFVELVKKTR